METLRPLSPASLRPGAEVGSWRILSPHAHGAYGTVYRVQKVGEPLSRSFALKLATYPKDPRFAREVELLSRIHSPHIPRLQEHGWWLSAGGVPFPFLVMDWVEGLPLYEWAAHPMLTSRQALRLLAQLARALEATHAAGCLHRDVKGDNALVVLRASGLLLLLVDFGAGDFHGAPTLTREPLPPGTPQYRSPEALRFKFQWRHPSSSHYEPGPADDVYALGVLAYRLVTGGYPPPALALEKAEEGYRSFRPPLEPPEALVLLAPELAALIRQMLAEQPSARGSAAQLALAFEHAAETAGPEADQPITPRSAQAPAPHTAQAPTPRAAQLPTPHSAQNATPHSAQAATPHSAQPVPPRPAREWPVWLTAAAVALPLTLGTWWAVQLQSAERSAGVTHEAPEDDKEDAGTSGLGHAVLSAPLSASQPAQGQRKIALDMPKKPFPGQRLPPCEPPEVEINGGCWIDVRDVTPPCGARYYEWKKGCYAPMFSTPRPPTSEQP